MIIIGLPFLRKTMNMYVLILHTLCVGDHLACTLGGAIPRASSAAIKNACLLTLHWCYEVYSQISVTLGRDSGSYRPWVCFHHIQKSSGSCLGGIWKNSLTQEFCSLLRGPTDTASPGRKPEPLQTMVILATGDKNFLSGYLSGVCGEKAGCAPPEILCSHGGGSASALRRQDQRKNYR